MKASLERIVIIDDDPMWLVILHKDCRALYPQAELIRSFEPSVEICRGADLVVCDEKFDEIDASGFLFLQRLRAEGCTGRLVLYSSQVNRKRRFLNDAKIEIVSKKGSLKEYLHSSRNEPGAVMA